MDVTLTINGEARRLTLDDPRVTLLDALRQHLDLTGTKKGCDHGQCGACTVLLDGRRATSCLTFAVAQDGAEVVTAAGLAQDGLHPVQQAFVDNDAFQCGFCTPGQVCSAVGMLEELEQGSPSYVTEDLTSTASADDDEIRERMSGNLCRCGAYGGIRSAIREVSS